MIFIYFIFLYIYYYIFLHIQSLQAFLGVMHCVIRSLPLAAATLTVCVVLKKTHTDAWCERHLTGIEWCHFLIIRSISLSVCECWSDITRN